MTEVPPGLAGPPPADIVVPLKVRELAAGRAVRPVWENQLGGLTFEVGAGAEGFFVKWAEAGTGLDLLVEAERMRWLSGYSKAPEVVEAGSSTGSSGGDGAAGSWLVTRPLPGASAVSERWKAEPAVAVAAIAAGLRHLHTEVPVKACPFTWDVQGRVAAAHERAAAGLTHPEALHPQFSAVPLTELLARAAEPPPVDRLVVCQGDACAPNTIVDEQGRWAGHVDLATLGVADRWADLAVASWSLEWNFGSGWEPAFFSEYGVEPDPERIAYHRLLWELT